MRSLGASSARELVADASQEFGPVAQPRFISGVVDRQSCLVDELLRALLPGNPVLGHVAHGILRANLDVDLRPDYGDVCERIDQDVVDLGVDASDLEEILRRMREFSVRGLNQDPLALEELRAQVIEGLRQFEYRLWRDIEGDEGERLFLAGADEVPPGYRELVEAYYKNLASRK